MMSHYARLAVIAAVLLTLGAGVWKLYHTGYQAGATATQAEYQSRALEAERQARAAEQAKVAVVQQVEVRHEQTKRQAAADHAAAQSELDRLRDQLAAANGGSPPANPATTAGADDAARTRYVLGQCATSITTLAETADTIEARLIGLQDYVRTVCKN